MYKRQVDGDCSGGNPKLLEIYADGIVDFSLYSVENQINENTTWGNTLNLSAFGTVTDDFVYITTTGSLAMGSNGEPSSIASDFPSLDIANIISSGSININGDDRIRIILNSTGATIDQYGIENIDGSGENWEYADSYAKRLDGTVPDGNFAEINWMIPGAGVLNDLGVCQEGADTFETLIGGIGTYSTTPSTTPIISVSGTITELDYLEGNGPSSEDFFTISGINLTQDITITAPVNFEISLSTATGFGSTAVITPTMGTINNVEVFVRLASGLPSNFYTGDITIISDTVPDQIVTVSGEVLPVITCANIGDIIITEVMQNPSAAGNDPNGEYFELYNTTSDPIDIANWVIKDDNQSGETHIIASSVIIPALGYVAIGNEKVPNGGIVLDYTYENDISLGNTIDGIIIECNATIIDQVIWDNGTTFPNPNGASMELSIESLNSSANDIGTNWAEAITQFGDGDLGTPGSQNDNSNTLSISSFNEQSKRFIISPNPANTGFITVTTTSNSIIEINIFNILGKQLVSETMDNNSINISHLSPGIYIVQLDQNNASITQKLVIE